MVQNKRILNFIVKYLHYKQYVYIIFIYSLKIES